MYEPYRVGLSNEDNRLWIKLYSRKMNFVGIDEDRKINSYIVNLLFTKLIDGFELGISKQYHEIFVNNSWQLKNCRLEQQENSKIPMKTKIFNILNRRSPQGTKWSLRNYQESLEISGVLYYNGRKDENVITDRDGRVTLEIGKGSWHCHLKNQLDDNDSRDECLNDHYNWHKSRVFWLASIWLSFANQNQVSKNCAQFNLFSIGSFQQIILVRDVFPSLQILLPINQLFKGQNYSYQLLFQRLFLINLYEDYDFKQLGHSNEVTLYVNGIYEPYRVGLSNEDDQFWIRLYYRKVHFYGFDRQRKINLYILNLLFTKLVDGFELGISRFVERIAVNDSWQLKNCRLEQQENSKIPMKTKFLNILNGKSPQGTQWQSKNYHESIEISGILYYKGKKDDEVVTDNDGRVTLEIGKDSWHFHLKNQLDDNDSRDECLNDHYNWNKSRVFWLRLK
ncbi:hypothetical protein pb186bvf_012703 [Paramecium bursaria]